MVVDLCQWQAAELPRQSLSSKNVGSFCHWWGSLCQSGKMETFSREWLGLVGSDRVGISLSASLSADFEGRERKGCLHSPWHIKSFFTHMKNVCNHQCWANLPVWHKNFNVVIFLDTIHVINDRLWMMVLLTELYLFIPFSVTLTIFQGHSSFSFNWKFCLYSINSLSLHVSRVQQCKLQKCHDAYCLGIFYTCFHRERGGFHTFSTNTEKS